jgi:tRNA threonylcarbamoyladenosine biosynthesis protein TsaE
MMDIIRRTGGKHMVELTFDSKSVEDTNRLAEQVARIVQPGDVLALKGDLGAGKTTFTQAFARALGVQERVNSPTFTLIKEYRGRIPLYHMDLYRLNGEEEAAALGLEEYFDGEGVCIVEWADRLGEALPKDVVHITMEETSPHTRRIRVWGTDGPGCDRVKELLEA